jgi:Putative peptidoglycan binding domain
MPRFGPALPTGLLLTAAAIAPAVAPPTAVAAHRPVPRLAGVRCVPATASSCRSGVAVRVGKQLQLRGSGLTSGLRVSFRWPRGALATKLRRGGAGWVAVIPPGTRPGRVDVTVRDRAGRRSNRVRIAILAEPKPVSRPAVNGTGGTPEAFRGNGMWIWQLEKSDGGSADAIAARAAAAHITTVFVKAGDGSTRWTQFSPLLVGALRQHGLRVCAWQYVYGSSPEAEARVAADAVATGADCLVIDAESEYEGRYGAAQRYMGALRAAVGPAYPIGLTSFPYVDYHPNVPYSVFLAPGAAQVNLPQVYWKDIGGSVDAVSAHTLAQNRIYGAPIAPLGQTYQSPPDADVRRFRQLWAAYGSSGLSWWSWQATPEATWRVLDEPAPPATVEPDPGWPALGKPAKGDEVVWLQQHLSATYPSVTATRSYDDATVAAVKALQAQRGLPVTGRTDTETWAAALALPFTAVDWTATG